MKTHMNLRGSHPRAVMLLAALALAAASARAQKITAAPPTPAMPRELRMQSVLFDAEQIVLASRANPSNATVGAPVLPPDMKKTLRDRDVIMRDDGKINVEIVGPEGSEAKAALSLAGFGVEIENDWLNRVDAWAPADSLSAVARALPAGYFMERVGRPTYDATGGEGRAATNSDSYIAGGRTGAGVTVAIIDGGFDNFTQARTNGDVPPAIRTTQINYTANTWEDSTDGVHGTACVEAVYDHASAANYRIYKINSVTDMGVAVNDCIANGVRVISHSLSRYNLGWADNSGAACIAANNAATNGIIFCTSAGNRTGEHWQGGFNGNGDSWHDFVNGDETITLSLPAGGGGNFYLSWSNGADYDLFLYNSTLSTVVASSTNGGAAFESFGFTNPSAGTLTYHLSVRKISGADATLEIFCHTGGNGVNSFQHTQAANSTTSPSNATSSNVVTVAAVSFGSGNSPNGTSGIIASYSSNGPTNGGNTVPDISGPTNTGTTAYGGSFGGTSAATPNTAGVATVFISADTLMSGTGIRWLMTTMADTFRDWGAGGKDNLYGFGGVNLPDYQNNTIWLARNYGNVAALRSAPFYTFQAAANATVAGGRVLVLPGGGYPEIATVTTKAFTVDTLANDTTLG